MSNVQFEIKPTYKIKEGLRIVSFFIAIGIVVYSLVTPNYHFILMAVFFLLFPFLSSDAYLKVYSDFILVERKGAFSYLNSETKIGLEDVMDVSFFTRESRFIKAFFGAGAPPAEPEYVQPVIPAHLMLTFTNGKQQKVNKIGGKEDFLQAYNVIKENVETLKRAYPSHYPQMKTTEPIALVNPETVPLKSATVLKEIKPDYRYQTYIKYTLLVGGIVCFPVSLLLQDLAILRFFGLLLLFIAGFYTMLTSQRFLTLYDDRIVMQEKSFFKKDNYKITVLFTQVKKVTFLREQFHFLSARIHTADAEQQSQYTENRIVFTLKDETFKAIKRVGKKHDFYTVYSMVQLQLNKMHGTGNHELDSTP